MIDRTCIESKDNWQCTFKRTRPGVREPFDCLMRTIHGGFYWYTPYYHGLFASGATRTFNADWTRASLADGSLLLIAGPLPACLAPQVTP